MRSTRLMKYSRAMRLRQGFLAIGLLAVMAATAWSVEDTLINPHSELIFLATGAASCRDGHRSGRDGRLQAQVVGNELVTKLRERAKGIHGPGRFADCLRCHTGGDKGVEHYRTK